ncbi:MAG: hypothetical protein Q7S96_00195 [bacterium]|nr:hypothetical protein [bacterium]
MFGDLMASSEGIAREAAAAAGPDRIAQIRAVCAAFGELLPVHVAEDGTVFVFDEEHFEASACRIPAPQEICVRIAEMRAEDEAERTRRAARVRALAGGSIALLQALSMATEYAGDVPEELDRDERGIVWLDVGRNASHFFAVGVGPDEQRYVRSVGEPHCDEDDDEQHAVPTWERCYLGHL